MTNHLALKNDRHKTRVLRVVLASVFIDYINIGIIIPILPFYAENFGASGVDIGLLFGITPLIGMLAPPIWGRWSDRVGRRPALLLNIAGTVLSYVCLSLAHSLWMLFLARVLAGVFGSSLTIAQSYISDLADSNNRTKTLGFIEYTAVVGLLFGPVISGFSLGSEPEAINFYLPGLIAVLTSGTILAIAFLTLPRRGHRRGHRRSIEAPGQSTLSPQQFFADFKEVLQRPLMGTLFIIIVLAVLAAMSVQVIFALWCEHQFGWGPRQFCYVIVYYFICIAIIQSLSIGPISRRFGETGLLAIGVTSGAIGLFLLPLSDHPSQFFVALLFPATAEALSYTARAALVTKLARAKQQGKTLGVMHSIADLSRFAGAILSGYLFGAIGPDSPYFVSGGLMMIAAVLCWLRLNNSKLSLTMHHRRHQKFLHLFEILDHDRSGMIELRDFYQMSQDLAKSRGWSASSSDSKLLQTSLVGLGELLIQKADLNGDRKISQAEWLDCFEHPRIDYDFANFFLEILDIDHDGQITLNELRSFYQTYGIDSQSIEGVFDNLEPDQDGALSRENVKTIFSQFLYSDDLQAPGNWIFGAELPTRL